MLHTSSSLLPGSSGMQTISNWMTTSDDQQFLLVFILGTYFGPDLKCETPKNSVLQRICKGLPPYTIEQLAGTQIKTVEMERVYYYILRNADRRVKVNLPVLRQFFKGGLISGPQECISNHRQFPELFPPHLHMQTKFRDRHKLIANIVFINNPEVSHMIPDDLERFKRLTGLEVLLIDRAAATNFVVGIDRLAPQLSWPPVWDASFDRIPYSIVPFNNGSSSSFNPLTLHPVERVEPTMVFLPSQPLIEEWINLMNVFKSGIVLTGCAAEGQLGPLVGLVDIGICNEAYYFRISLPGVDNREKNFNCSIETNGHVKIVGVTTTGERFVFKQSRVFVMQSQNLSPPGTFSISFYLPGQVEKNTFKGYFYDGILQGIVWKLK